VDERAAMDATTTALIIAIVGVAGTLSASVISQILSARVTREELALQRSHRQEDYDRERLEAVLTQKRDCYISITSSSRRYRVELMNYLFAIKRGPTDSETNGRLEDARIAFSVSFAEAQLTGSLPVLEAITSLRNGLRDGYRAIRELESEPSRPDGSFTEVQKFLLELWDTWPPLHAAMRTDLGVVD
jgi:hypothetical protein